MKTSTLPPVRVADDLRSAIESVLVDGESLSGFIEGSVRRAVDFRRAQSEFQARAQASWEAYQRTGEAADADVVVAKLERKLTDALARRKRTATKST